MVLFVFGSRSVVDRVLVDRVLGWWSGVDTVWSGGARGADALGVAWARRRGLPVREWLADWGRFGRSAGVRRTRALVDELPADALCVCFAQSGCSSVGALSAGSAHSVRFCRERGLSVLVVFADGSLRWAPPGF